MGADELKEIERLRAETTDAVQQHVETGTGRVDRSPYAVLAKGFRGQLV